MKKHLKSILIFILSVLCVTAIALSAGCKKDNDDKSGNDNSTEQGGNTENENPHEHSYTSAVTDPTCTEKGYTTYTCACGNSYISDYVNATGHTPKAAVKENEVEATCKAEGSYDNVVRCLVCNEIISSTHNTIERKAHIYTGGVCSVCGDGNGTIYDLSEITLKNKTVTYDGNIQNITIDGTLPNGLSVVYDNNGKINAGTYSVTARVTDGKDIYKILTAVLTIEKRELNITFNGNTNLVYNGEVQKTITATAVNLAGNDTVNILITYSGDMVEEGVYTAIATIADNDNYVLTKNNTITVTIARSMHTVTFIQQGQPDIVRSVAALSDLEQSLIPTPVPITGYIVTWEEKDLTSITEDIIVNAIKTPIEYHITYVLNGGKNHADNPEIYTIETPTFYLGAPTKAASTFSGWYTTANFLMDSRVLLIESGNHSDITLYAHWLEYRITSAIGFEIDMEQEPPLVYREVSYSTENLDLNDKISVSSGCTWNLYRDFEGNLELKLKAISLEIGHNYAYIIVYHPDGIHFSRYKLDVYRLDMKKYAFIDGAYTGGALGEIFGEITGNDILDDLLNAGSLNIAYASGTIQEKSELYAPENPSRAFYNFAGWVIGSGTDVCTFPYTILADTVFYSLYTPIEYEIFYHANGGVISTVKNSFNVLSTFYFDIPEKTGYDFAGWYMTEDFSDIPTTGIVAGTYYDINLYAKWTPHVYDISYNLNNGVNSDENPVTYTIETPEITFKAATRTAYTFGGWFTDENLTVSVTTVPLGSYGDIEIYAKWNPIVYKITYAIDGGTLETEANDYHADKSVVLDVPEKDYYDFAGWYDNAEFNGDVITEIAVGNYGDKTFYAKWTPTVYTITYELNGGTFETEVNDYHIEKSVIFDQPSREYYDFTGWYDNVQLTGEAIIGIEVGNHGDKTYYAKWTPVVYAITYELNGGTLETDKNDYHIEKAVTFDEAERAGYEFKGWYDNTEFNGDAITEIAVGNHGDKTYYAKWEIVIYSISYVLNEGALVTDKNSYTVEMEFALDEPAKEYYDFVGWCEKEDLSDEAVTEISVGTYGNKLFYAKYILHEYKITYMLNGGEVNGDLRTSFTVEDLPFDLNLNTPRKENYFFEGWYTDSKFSTPLAQITEVGDITVYSKWLKAEDYFTFSTNNTGYTVTGYNGTFTDIVIPSVYKNKPVTSIGSYAFRDCSGLTSVTIGNNVTSIGGSAFSGCSSLESITLPFVGGSVKTAEDTYQYPFGYIFGTSSYTGGTATKQYYYGSSTSITTYNTYYIPSSLKEVTITGGNILYDAFKDCSGLTSVTIGDSVTSIGDCAFFNCSSLESVTIGNSVTSIGSSAFYNCSGLTSITIPDGVTSIGYQAFEDCSALTSITIPDSVTSIGGSAFKNCSSLTSITIPDGVTSIGSSAFSGCSGLTSITIPDGVTSIGSYAFSGCSALTSIYITDLTAWCRISGLDNLMSSNRTLYLNGEELCGELVIPDGVTSIGNYAFSGCSGLTSVTIGNGVTSIGSSAFAYCSSLTSITIPDSVTSIGDGAFFNCSSLESVTIGNSVTSIGSSAFRYCSGLTSITIPDSVTSIGDSAFSYCSGLTSITIPDGVTSIGYQAFEDCSALTSVTIGNSVTSIGNYAFEDCSSLTSITIPDSVTSIGDSAFYNCSALTSIYITDLTAWCRISGLDNLMSYGSNNKKLYLNGTEITELIIPDSVTSIGGSAFKNCSSLTSITIPDGVTSIGSSAFSGCSGLTSITIPDGVTSIGSSAFYGCSGLTSITIPDGVTSIGYQAFYNCSSLTSITIPDSVTSIGDSAFSYCSGLTSITIPDGVTSIGYQAFYNCSALTSITIPDSVTSIGSYAFRYCSSLTSITIPDSVTSIGDSAFSVCSGLTSVYYNGTAEDWVKISIGSYNTSLTNATRYYYSETEPEIYGNYWHYDGSGIIAIWEYTKEQTYNFNSNGGTEVESITAILISELPITTKEGWYFDGWYDNEELSGRAVSFPYYKNGGATLYAKWLTEEEFYKGSSFERAKQAESGQTYTVDIVTGGQLYYFSYTATESGTLTVTSNGNSDTYGYLYNSSQSQLKSDDDSGTDSNFSLTYTVTAGETYYVAVKFYSSSNTGSFTVTFN